MTRLFLAAALVSGAATVARADGWVDCNGPDKQGHGCSASRDGATTGAALLVVGLVAFTIGRPRRPRGPEASRDDARR